MKQVNFGNKYLPAGVERVCSPFLGGGSLELEMARMGIEVHAYDSFAPLIVFWQAMLHHPSAVAERAKRYLPMTAARFHALKAAIESAEDRIEMAAMFFALNRASFSGATLSGGMSAGAVRFNAASIARLERFKTDRLHVARADFRDSIPRHKEDFLYLDPPYMVAPRLYGRNGDTHRHFDHGALAGILTRRDGWMLSYNDCPQVRELYKGYPIVRPQWAYGMSRKKTSNELLILSKDYVKM